MANTAYPVRRFMPWRGLLLERWECGVKCIELRGTPIVIREDRGEYSAKIVRKGKPGTEVKIPEP